MFKTLKNAFKNLKKICVGYCTPEFQVLISKARQGHKLKFFCPKSQWEESFFPKTSVAIVILFWLKWAGYLAVAGLNLLAQISDRISPYGV